MLLYKNACCTPPQVGAGYEYGRGADSIVLRSVFSVSSDPRLSHPLRCFSESSLPVVPDCASRELQDFACALYKSRGEFCRAPVGSGVRDVLAMDGSMFLVEMIEIKPTYRGMDLGMHFLHEYLAHPQIAKRIGLVVMYPWAVDNTGILHFVENRNMAERQKEGLDESEKVDVTRRNTVKLRRQYSRMGFRAVADSHDWANKWYMSMEKYKTTTPSSVKGAWPSKEEVSQLGIPMPTRKHVDSDKDEEMKHLLESLKPNESDPFTAQLGDLRRQLELLQHMQDIQQRVSEATRSGSDTTITSEAQNINALVSRWSDDSGGRSKLTSEKKSEIRRLVDAGANLNGIHALHVAASCYKESDLFNLLVDEYGMSVEQFDCIGRRPLHVAACCTNADAVRILISKGADKNGRNEEGQTTLQEVDQMQRSMGDFARSMMGGIGSSDAGVVTIRNLLRG